LIGRIIKKRRKNTTRKSERNKTNHGMEGGDSLLCVRRVRLGQLWTEGYRETGERGGLEEASIKTLEKEKRVENFQNTIKMGGKCGKFSPAK